MARCKFRSPARVTAVLLLLTGVSGIASALSSEARASEFKPGDRVEVERGRRWVPGEVIRIRSNGWVDVETEDIPHAFPYPVRKVRRPPAAEAADRVDETDNPFATPDEKAVDKLRTWTDDTGQFQIEGTFVGLEEGQVTLKREDDQEVEVPLERLSRIDRRFVEQILGIEEESLDNDPPREVELTDTDVRTAFPADVSRTATWEFEPDPAGAALELPAARIPLGPARDFFEKPTEILLLPEQKKAFVVFLLGHGRDLHSSRVVACDLERRRVEASGVFAVGRVPIDVSPDGSTVLARSSAFGHGSASELSLYTVSDGRATLNARWEPYGNGRSSSTDVEWARFLDSSHVATLSSGGVLAVWKLPELEPLFTAAGSRSMQPAVSPGANQIAIASKEGVVILDSRSGEKLGFLDAPAISVHRCSLAFRQDGKRLAMHQSGRIRMWDLESQKLDRDFSVRAPSFHERLTWVGESEILLGGRHVIDLERRIVLWNYRGVQPGSVAHDGRLWFLQQEHMHGEKGYILSTGRVPHEAALEVARQLDPEELLVIRPGMTVSIELQVTGTAEQRDGIHEALTAQLEANGMQIVDAGEVVLRATAKPGKSERVTYGRFGGFVEQTQHTVTPMVTSVELIVEEQSVWKRGGSTGAPHMIRPEEGESRDQAIRRSIKSSVNYLGQIWIPDYVAVEPEEGAYGHSDVPVGL